jgi:hypothetical protein
MKLRLAFGMSVAILAIGCGPRLIPNLEIELKDTPDNRALLQIMEKFRQSYENLDIEALLLLASDKFYEDCGTNDTSDDYNKDGLRAHFAEHFKMIKKCNLEIILKDVKVKGDKATIDYRYVARYLMALPAGEKWQLTDEINQMEFAREKDAWMVTSGM